MPPGFQIGIGRGSGDISLLCAGHDLRTFQMRTPTRSNLVARSIGIPAAISSVGSTCSHGGGSDAYRHSTAYGCTTIDAAAIDTTVVNANATNSNGSSICEASVEIVAIHTMLTITDAASETMNRLDMTDPFLKAGDQVESRESSASRLCRNDHGPPIHRRTHLRFFLKLIYDTALIGLTFLSPDCRHLQINQRLTEICGI